MKIKRKTFVGGLLATLCACATVITGLSFAGGNTVAAAEDVPVKQSAAYLNLDGGTNILNGFEGAQKEKVYFGTNNGSPVKWRVLSKNGSNYGSGMLLWADSQITQEAYNTYAYNLDYAFWGTSKIRALLNGGIYYNAVSNQTDAPTATTPVSETDSWYGKLFNLTEQKAVEETGSYVTDLWGCNVNYPTYLYSKAGITVTSTENDNSNNVCGKYNINRIDATSHPTSQYAYYNTTYGTVWEETSGDKLFLLDYYDINNADYGFGDSGQTYENKVTAYAYSGTPQSDVFACYFDGAGTAYNNITSNYLKDTGGTPYYWLRNPGRQNNAKSDALLVCSWGCIASHFCSIDGAAGIRPAFNLDTTKIVYANSKSVSVGSTFTDVTTNASVTTPEYKLYVKSADYNTYSSKAISTMRVEGGNLKVIYNNPAEIESGNIVVLLTEKGSTDGAVAYQASATISSTTNASKTAVASFSLSGIDYSQYDTTVLLTSANGGNYAETVYCSYNMEGNVTVPSDVENLTYDGTCKWVGSLSTKPDWFDENLHINDNVMTVTAISYKSMAKDATFTPLTATGGKKLTDLIVDAGEYEVTMTLDNGLKWAGSNTTGGDKKFKIKIG
ncbi:MAG: hypothetical protein K2O62_01560, partial [Clostridia bacterium]|nr:hypothetical protein [Clostridia bacterium]